MRSLFISFCQPLLVLGFVAGAYAVDPQTPSLPIPEPSIIILLGAGLLGGGLVLRKMKKK